MSGKPNWGFALLAPLALGACSASSNSEGVPLGACASELNAEQGTRMQAVSLQGISPQGISPQGISSQGISPQGTRLQGLALQGISPQGTRLGSAPRASGKFEGDPAGLELRGGELVASGGAGLLEGAELRGLRLPFVTSAAETLWLTIARAERPAGPNDAWLYALELGGESLCEGDGLGVFVPGVWDETGRHLAALEAGGRTLEATFSCPAGVIAKCVSWGYAPSQVGAELHQACTRMARADYCGDGVAHTEDGTLIDLFDERSIQSPVTDDSLSFEAGWGADGAVCVSQPRYRDISSKAEPELPACWGDKRRCDSWDKARKLGAVLGNDSAHALRSPRCEAP